MKPLRYVLLDLLILTSPVTAFATIACALNPRWRERPADWRTSRRIRRYYVLWLYRHVALMLVMGMLSASGIVTFIVHLMGWV
jgi:hypothetical protein